MLINISAPGRLNEGAGLIVYDPEIPPLQNFGFSLNPSTELGKIFGMQLAPNVGIVYVPANTPANGIISFDSSFGEWVWNEENLANIGFGSLTTPVAV